VAPSDLGIRQASELIDELKGGEDDEAGRGEANGTFAGTGGAR